MIFENSGCIFYRFGEIFLREIRNRFVYKEIIEMLGDLIKVIDRDYKLIFVFEN